MNEPKRLRDDLDMPFERELLRAADLDRAPEGAENAAIEALGLGLAAGLTVARTTSTAAPALVGSKAGASGALLALKWIGVALVVGSLTALGVRVFASHGSPVSVAAAPTLPLFPPTAPARPREDVNAPRAPRAEDTSTPNVMEIGADDPTPAIAPKELGVVSRAAPSDSASTLGAELQMIDRARKAIAAHDANGASVVLDDYARTFPHGALREEAGVARIEALLEGGKPGRALTEGDLFDARYPDSAYQKTVAALKKRALLMEMGRASQSPAEEKTTAH